MPVKRQPLISEVVAPDFRVGKQFAAFQQQKRASPASAKNSRRNAAGSAPRP